MKSDESRPLSIHTLQDTETLLNILSDHLPADSAPTSIYLSGQFARGEGGHFHEGGRWLPFGDYIFDVILPRPLLDREEQRIFDRIGERMGPRAFVASKPAHVNAGLRPPRGFDLRFKTLEEFRTIPSDLDAFDFRHSHKLVFGKDLAISLDPLEVWEVSLFSPWRILGNRLLLALKSVDTDFLDRVLTFDEILGFRHSICHLLLDLAGLLTFLMGQYQVENAKRIETLANSASLWRGWIENPNRFLERLRSTLDFMKLPHFEPLDGQSLFGEWFEILSEVGRILPHLINLVLLSKTASMEKISQIVNQSPAEKSTLPMVIDPFLADWKPLVARQVRQYPGLFYRDFLIHTIRRSGRTLPATGTLCGFASRYYGVFENATWKGRNWVLKNLRRSVLSPEAFQSAVLPLLLFSLTPGWKVKIEALEFFDRLMEPYMLMPFDFLPELKRWEATKRCLVHEMLDYRKR